MANVEKLNIGSDTYDLRDATAVHTVDAAMSASSTNPVQNKVAKEYVDDAIQNEPYMRLGISSNFQYAVLIFYNFKNLPTTYEDLVAQDDFKMALARPIVVDAGVIDNPVVQGLVLNMDGIPSSNHWIIVFPDGIAFNGMLLNGVQGDLTFDSSEDLWYLDNFSANTPEFKYYTDDAIGTFAGTLNYMSSGLSASKTITVAEQSNGLLAVSAEDIAIVSTQVEANATEAATPASGDGLIFADSDDSNKLKRMTNGFGTSTTTFLRNDGTWAAPPSSEAPVARIFHGTCSTAAGTVAKVVTCPQFLASDLVTGAIVFVTFTATNSGTAANLTLNVNSTGAMSIKYMRNAAESNLPGNGYLRANMTYRFVYNGTYWVCDTDYDSDRFLVYRSFRVASGAGSLYSYHLVAINNNGDIIPFNNVTTNATTTYTKAMNATPFDPFRGFLYYMGTTTTSAGSVRDANEFATGYAFDCRYSFNINSSGTAGSTALTAFDPVYVRALYDTSTRLATFAANTSSTSYLERSSIVQVLPSSDPNTDLAAGTFYVYILVGQAYTKYNIALFDNNTVYYWNTKAGMMTEFTGIIEADYATPADISTAINALDASASGLSASKTITALLETNGVISASASDIAIDASQVTTGTFASNRIYSDATMATAIESGDSVIFVDSNDSNKLKRMSNGFDTTKTAEFLRRDGSWAAPPSGTNTTYTFADGTNGFTVTPSDGTAQTVKVTPSISEIKNDLTLLKEGTTPGDSHSLIFQRGTLTDNYNDWRIQDRGGFLYFDQRGSGSTSWANQVVFNTSGNVSATSFSGSGASLTSLNASNISSGTLNAARLPSGLEYTSNMTQTVNSSSTVTEYPSAKAVYDAIDGLDASVSGLGASKTITALLETNGVISASASDIAIDASQITSGTLPTTRLLRPTGENAGTIVGDVTINAQIDNMRANRLAFIPADHIIVERTTDNGSTWTAGEYSATDKKHLFAGTRGSRLYIPRINSARNVNCGLRVTFTAMNYNVPEGTTEANWYQYWNSSNIASAERYTQLKELYFFVNTVNDGLSCKIEAAKGSSSTTWVTLYDSATTTATPFALTGYTGADYVRLVGGPFTFGGGTTQTGNYWNYRITFFTRDANGGTNLSTSSTDVQQYITQICGYGPVSWTNANRLMYNDHLYRWDQDQNATFPADVTAATFTGDGSNLTSIVSTQIEANATESAAVGTGDGLIFADSDDSNKLKRMTSGFDVSNNTSFLRQDGVWAVPAGGGTTGIFKGTCATGAAGDPKVVTCPEFTSSDLVKGAVIFVTFTYTNSASVNTVQMNVNGTGAKRIMQIKNTVLGTMTTNGELVANQTYMFTYDGTYWVLSNDDDRTNVAALGNGHKNIGTTYRYQFLVSAPKDDTNTTDHKRALYAINAVNSGSTTYTKAFRTWSFDPFGIFAYWNSVDTVSSEGTFGDPTRLQIEGSVAGNYAFNLKQNGTAGTQGFVDNKAVYMKAKYNFATQTATFWQDTASANYLDRSGLVQELPTTNPNTSTDTYIYIYLGQAYGGDARTFYLLPYHPVYMWNEAKGGMDLFTGGPMEGSGTCTISDGSGTSFTANYYKVGRQVTVSGTIPSVGSTATALVGLPFAPVDNVQTTLTWTDSSLMSMVVARLSIASGSKNLTPMGYAKVGVTSTFNAGSWLNQVPSTGVPFNVTYVTDVP